tara:strand:+ start:678 stop:1553 length:876 start_codon:yes stop_codon:yes gene_type:complete
MAHNNHIIDGINKDLTHFYDREYYLDLAKDWEDPFGMPKIKNHNGFDVVRDDLLEYGSKCRFGDLLISQVKEDTLVYVQPRFGYAGISLSYLAHKYNKRLILFMPSSKQISEHQAVCIERGAIPKFRRIAAMPNLNRIAKQWSLENNAFFIPLGLVHPLVTAAIVKICENLRGSWKDPETIWCAISTGVLSRGLQIGFPNTNFKAVAVARNLKQGELGRSDVFSHYKSFHSNVDIKYDPPFPSASNYDAKVWEFMIKHGKEGDMMWNVAGNCASKLNKDNIDSQRQWGEIR